MSDINMPEMSGFEFLPIVRQRFASIYISDKTVVWAADAGDRTMLFSGFH